MPDRGAGQLAADSPVFVLDRADNPHPRMLAGALKARREAKGRRLWDKEGAYWLGYLAAMADATGCAEDDLEAWMDAHEVKR